MQNSATVRRHFNSAEREKILQDHQASRLPDKEFARQAGVGISTFYAWRRKAAAGRPADGAVFVAVPNLLATAPAAPVYRLQWPGGLSLEVRAGFATPELAALLQLLPAL
jgi:transposase-like protein